MRIRGWLMLALAITAGSLANEAWGQTSCKGNLPSCFTVSSVAARAGGNYQEMVEPGVVVRMVPAAGRFSDFQKKEQADLIAGYAKGRSQSVDKTTPGKKTTSLGEADTVVVDMTVGGLPRQVALAFVEVTHNAQKFWVIIATFQVNTSFPGQAQALLNNALAQIPARS